MGIFDRVEPPTTSSTRLTIPEGRELRPYQVRAATDLIVRQRHYLADGPGVGKTPPTVVAVASLGFPDTLIVCQKRAIGVWESHFEEWYGVKVKTYTAGKAKYADITTPGILVTNYEQLGDIYERRKHWPIIIFDEAHEMRNRNSIRYTKAKHFTSSYLWLLSGTPVFKGAQDLWAPLAMIAPRQFPAYWPFVNKYCNKDRGWGGSTNVYGIKDPLRLAKDISPFFLRRRKKDVLPELPEKARYKIPVHMTPKQKAAYIDLVKKMYTEAEDRLVMVQSAAVRTIRLRELLVSPRLLGIDDDGAAIPFLIDRLEERGTPSAIATPFRKGVAEIGRMVGLAGWEVFEMVGGLSAPRTAEIWQGFQKSTTKKRVIVYTTSMGTAWNGTMAEQFYAVEYEWAPQINEQAEDRMNRYGGTGWECYYFTHFGTIDEHVLEVNTGKQTVENLIMNHSLILDKGRM